MLLTIKPVYSFGENAFDGLAKHLKKLSQKPKVLLLFGRSSAKTNGSYDAVVNILKELQIEFVEFWNIEPNPKSTTCDAAYQLGIKEKVNLTIAVGGGSVIDAAKVINFMINNSDKYQDSWSYVTGFNRKLDNKKPTTLIAVLTLSGTASENNGGSVITNPHTNSKRAIHNNQATPVLTVLDPKLTYTANAWQTASAGFDCLAHLIEQYLGEKPIFNWCEEYLFANMRVLIKNLPTAVSEPKNYDARANVMWAASWSLNQLSSMQVDNYNGSDWKVHWLEHALSGLYDITHGAGLALVYPTYLRVQKKLASETFKKRFTNMAEKVFGVNSYDEGIVWLEKFISSINLPNKLSDFSEIKEYTQKDQQFLVDHFMKDTNQDEKYKILAESVYKALKF